jgi:hypothetical protein
MHTGLGGEEEEDSDSSVPVDASTASSSPHSLGSLDSERSASDSGSETAPNPSANSPPPTTGCAGSDNATVDANCDVGASAVAGGGSASDSASTPCPDAQTKSTLASSPSTAGLALTAAEDKEYVEKYLTDDLANGESILGLVDSVESALALLLRHADQHPVEVGCNDVQKLYI